MLLYSRSPNTAVEVDRNILTLEGRHKIGLSAVGDFRIAEVSVGGAEWVPLSPPGEDEVLRKRHRQNSQGGRTAKEREND